MGAARGSGQRASDGSGWSRYWSGTCRGQGRATERAQRAPAELKNCILYSLYMKRVTEAEGGHHSGGLEVDAVGGGDGGASLGAGPSASSFGFNAGLGTVGRASDPARGWAPARCPPATEGTFTWPYGQCRHLFPQHRPRCRCASSVKTVYPVAGSLYVAWPACAIACTQRRRAGQDDEG